MNIKKVILITPIVTLQCYGTTSFQESLPNSASNSQFINNNMQFKKIQEVNNLSQSMQTPQREFQYIPQHFSYPDPSNPIYQKLFNESTPQPITQPEANLKQVTPQKVTEEGSYSYGQIFQETEDAGKNETEDESYPVEEDVLFNGKNDIKITKKFLLRREKSCCERCMNKIQELYSKFDIRDLYGKLNIWSMFTDVAQKEKPE